MHHSIRSSAAPLRRVPTAFMAALATGSFLLVLSPLRAEADGGARPLPQAAMEQGRALFLDTGCSQCHSLADADAAGAYGPSLDGNPELTPALALDRITNGRGDMPSFAGILSDEQLAQLASYVAAASRGGETS